MKSRMQAPVLNRVEIERIAIHMALDRNIQRVQIIQRLESGIGATTHARFYRGEAYEDVDVTDLGAW
jgi:hypothetical protein